MKKLLNETIIYGIGAILPRIIVVLLNPLYIHFLNPSDFAKFSNLYAAISFVNIVLSFGFETAFFRFSADKENEKKTFSTSYWFLFGLSTLFLIACLLFNQPIANQLGYPDNPEYIRWFAWIAFFDNLCIIPFAWLRFNNKPIKYSAVRVAQALFQTIAVIILFLYIPLQSTSFLGIKDQVAYPFYTNMLASIFGFLLLLPIALKVKFEFATDLFKKMIKYAWPIMIAGLAFMFNENFDKFIQFHLIDKEDAGAYGGCYKIAVLMTLFVTAYRMGIEPFFFKQMKSENAKNSYAKVAEYFAVFASVACMAIIANVSWIKLLLVPNSSYWSAIDIVPIIVIANLCFGIYYNFSTWYKVTDQTFYGTIISWLGALITIVLNLVFLKEYGFMVSAWVTLLAYFIMMFTSYFLGQKHYPIPYKIGKISSLLFLLIIFSAILSKVFDYNFWIGNTLLIVYFIFVLYLEKDLIKKLLRK